jgi:hypothetical protein
MSRPKGGIIGARPTWTTTATSGIWTLREAEEMKAAGQWPRGPVAPTSLAGSPGDTQVALTWVAPANTHGTITDYAVEYTPSGGSPTVVLAGSTAASYTVAGLTNDTEYTFRVRGINHTRGDWSSTATATPTAVTPDPDFASVVLLLNADNNVTDASNNNVQLDAWSSYGAGKFGAGSFDFVGQSSGVYRASDTLTLGSSEYQPFTVEMWFKCTSNGSPQMLFNTGAIQLVVASSGAVSAAQGAANISSASTGFDDGNWHHVAAVKNTSRTLFLYVDGVYAGEGFTSFNSPSGDYISIGHYPGIGWTVNGFVDEVRVTKLQRYTANFTPPTAAFPSQ